MAIKVDIEALTVSDVMLAMIANPFSVVYLSADINPPLKKALYNCTHNTEK